MSKQSIGPGFTDFVLFGGGAELLAGGGLELPKSPVVVEVGTAVGGRLVINVADHSSVASVDLNSFNVGPMCRPRQLRDGDERILGIAPLDADSLFIAGAGLPPTVPPLGRIHDKRL